MPSHRKFDRRLKNSDSLARRVDEHADFVNSLENETVWVREQIVALEMQIEELRDGAEALDARINARPGITKGADRLLHLQDAGEIHALRKTMTRFATEVEVLLSDIHGHPAFRDDVSAIAPLTIPEEHRGHGMFDHFKAENVFLSALNELNRMSDALRRLRRRMTLYLGQKKSIDTQIAQSRQWDEVVTSFASRKKNG